VGRGGASPTPSTGWHRARHDQFIIERKGKPLAALVPVEKLEQMDRAARFLLLEILERQKAAASLSQVEAERLADEAKHRQRRAPASTPPSTPTPPVWRPPAERRGIALRR
jgi:antitoxin (DNA-binding transcriptional repressor) of toxin-antitoxin stability system